MKTIEDKKIYVFDDDDELTTFCIDPNPVIKTHKKLGIKYFDYEMTPCYMDAIKNGYTFAVRDPKSRAVKNGHLSIGSITNKIECIPWDDDDEEYDD